MTNPFTPPPGGFGFGFGPAIDAHFTSSDVRPIAHSASSFGTMSASTTAVLALMPTLASAPGRGFEFGFDPRGGFGFGPAPAAPGAAAADAANAATSAPPSSSCWPNGRCTATR